jgi:hypothetical protein
VEVQGINGRKNADDFTAYKEQTMGVVVVQRLDYVN